MKKRSCYHFSAYAGLALLIGVVFTSGCAFMNSEYLVRNVPVSPSSIYVSREPLTKPKPIQYAQTTVPKGQVLSLAQCIEIALERNPQTRASWQAARSAAAEVGQAKSAYLPSADFTGGANRSDSVNLDSQRDNGPYNNFDAEFGVRYLLLDGGARSAGLKGAEAALLNANFQHNAVLQDVALKVEEAYYQLLAAKQLKRVAEETVHQTQYHVDIARARHENGLVAKSDVLKAETEKANAVLQLVRARNQVRIAHGKLANAMGLNPSKPLEVAGLPQNAHQRELADVKKLMAEASIRRPELQAAITRIESARANVKAEKARYWPKIAFYSDYGRRDHSFFPDRNEWSFGIGISWPLFDGLNREYSIRRAKSGLSKTLAEHETLLRGVELEVWTAYSQLVEAGQAIEAAKALVASAEESARVTEGEYKEGTATIIEVTDTQTARTWANVRLVQARLDWYTAIARLERAIGQTLTQPISLAANGENLP